ncbi:hypothetical protein GQR58_002755 [Nymphon striatum]|nr:hypothetical protein GQR58_002755 [Nymphon striatum]
MENGCLVPDWFDGPVIPADLFHDKEDTDVDTGDQQAVDDAEYDDGSSTDSEWSDDSVMDDAYTLNKVSWIMDYSKSAKWFYKLNQKLEFSPSIRLFVISIDHVEGLKEKGIKVIINYAYSDYKKKTSRKNTMGYWQLKSGLSTIVPYSRCCYNMSGYRIKIVYAKGDLPYGNVEKTGNNLKITGIAGSILEEILNILDIRSEYEAYGIIQKFSKKQADIAVSVLGHTEDRNTVADFTLSVMQERIIGLYKPPDNSNSHFWSFYVKPFSFSSWILILTMILLLMMFSVILMRYFPQSGIGEVNQFDILVIWGLQLNQGIVQ